MKSRVRVLGTDGHRIKILAIWYDPNCGLQGGIGILLWDNTPVYFCSKEKWDLGPKDSLRRGWNGNIRIGAKTITSTYTEHELKMHGLGHGTLCISLPNELTMCKQCRPFEVCMFTSQFKDHVANYHKAPVEKETYEIANAFDQYANVFNTTHAALTFVGKHRPGHVVVKVGRKYVPATPEFAKKMGLKVIKE